MTTRFLYAALTMLLALSFYFLAIIQTEKTFWAYVFTGPIFVITIGFIAYKYKEQITYTPLLTIAVAFIYGAWIQLIVLPGDDNGDLYLKALFITTIFVGGTVCTYIFNCRLNPLNFTKVKVEISEVRLIALSIVLICIYLYLISKSEANFLESGKKFNDNESLGLGGFANYEYYILKASQAFDNLMLLFIPILANYKHKVNFRKYFLWLLFLLILSLFINAAIAFSSKASLLMFLIQVLFLTLIFWGPIKGYLLFIYFAGITTLMAISAFLRSGGGYDVQELFIKLFSGNYFLSVRRLSHIIEYNPDIYAYFSNGAFLVNYVLMGKWIGSEVFGFILTGVPPGLIAELWMLGGIPLVIFGAVFFGYLVARSGKIFYNKADYYPRVIALYLFVGLPLLSLNSSFGSFLYQFVMDACFFTLFYLAVKKY